MTQERLRQILLTLFLAMAVCIPGEVAAHGKLPLWALAATSFILGAARVLP